MPETPEARSRLAATPKRHRAHCRRTEPRVSPLWSRSLLSTTPVAFSRLGSREGSNCLKWPASQLLMGRHLDGKTREWPCHWLWDESLGYYEIDHMPACHCTQVRLGIPMAAWWFERHWVSGLFRIPPRQQIRFKWLQQRITSLLPILSACSTTSSGRSDPVLQTVQLGHGFVDGPDVTLGTYKINWPLR